jgi:peptidase M50-like protein
VSFDRPRLVSPSPQRPRRSVLLASTDDDRLAWPVRVMSLVGGLVFAALGAGLAALLILAGRQKLRQGIPSLESLLLLPLPLGIALYGIDLMGRGLLGRPWGRRVWRSAGGWVASRLSTPKAAFIVVAILAVSGVVGWLRRGPQELELALTLPAAFLHILFHELGHLGAARAVGYKPRALAAGPLFLRVDGSRTRFSFNRSWLQLVGGLALYEPVGRTPGRDLLVAAAGPLMNLALAAAALELWGWPAPSGVSEIFLRTFIGLGFAVAIFNLLPLPRTTDGFALDGREILDLLRRLAAG